MVRGPAMKVQAIPIPIVFLSDFFLPGFEVPANSLFGGGCVGDHEHRRLANNRNLTDIIFESHIILPHYIITILDY